MRKRRPASCSWPAASLSSPPGADALCDEKPGKIIAAPCLPEAQFSALQELCAGRGIHCIAEGMRKHPGGIDIGFTIADAGIAETGTLLINSKSEELRLASMLCEVHVCVLRVGTLCETSYEAEGLLKSMTKDGPAYVAFVTGASRTADIERVLAIGVHGPLELHILLLED